LIFININNNPYKKQYNNNKRVYFPLFSSNSSLQYKFWLTRMSSVMSPHDVGGLSRHFGSAVAVYVPFRQSILLYNRCIGFTRLFKFSGTSRRSRDLTICTGIGHRKKKNLNSNICLSEITKKTKQEACK
jgi:hypothetical protein